MLTGTIPDMSNLTDLVLLDLSDNELKGPLPAYWAASTALAYFAVQSNQLTGTIPVSHATERYLGVSSLIIASHTAIACCIRRW